MAEAPRSLEQRKTDSLHRLQADKDLWIASGDSEGQPCLVPVSFLWNGTHILIATRETNPTGRNLIASSRSAVSLGHPRDVVLIEATAKLLRADEVPPAEGDAYAAKCGWDPREDKNYSFFQLQPQQIQAWREFNEHPNRYLMRNGNWLA